MRTFLLSAALVGLVVFASLEAQETGNTAQPQTRRGFGIGTRRGNAPVVAGTQYLETETGRWLVHDMDRPAPPIITPGTESTQEQPGKAPSDAIVLFDGNDPLV